MPLVTWGLWGLPYVMLDSVSLERYMYTQHNNNGVILNFLEMIMGTGYTTELH